MLYLWHVADARARDAATLGARLATQHPDLTAVESSAAYDTAEQRRLAAATRTQQSISDR